jgi:hypothetical protein
MIAILESTHMTTSRELRLHGTDTRRTGPLQWALSRIEGLWPRVRFRAPVASGVPASSEAPWIAEMLSAFGDAILPVAHDSPDGARAGHPVPALRRRSLHLS